MKKGDIKVGEEYAVVPGSGDYYESFAARARVIEVGLARETVDYKHSFRGVKGTRTDGVLVELTEDPPKRYSDAWQNGERLTLTTRNVLHPWAVEEHRREARAERVASREEQEQRALRAIDTFSAGKLSRSPSGPKILLDLAEAEAIAERLAPVQGNAGTTTATPPSGAEGEAPNPESRGVGGAR